MKAAQLFVKSLEVSGVKYMFGVPGEENLALLDAVRTSSIEFIVTRDEQAATFMAAAVGRLTGGVAVALSTLGPGATNLVTGVAYAQLAAIPLLVITGQKPIKKRRQGQFQVVDVVGMMRPLTKFSESIVSAHGVPSLVYQALRIAQSERPGAVHLELPEDIAEDESDNSPLKIVDSDRPVAGPDSIKRLVKAIESAKSPILVLGSGTNRNPNQSALHNFIKKTGMPFVTTQFGKGAADESLEEYIGTSTFSANDSVHRAFEASDLILMVGYDVFEKPALLPGKYKIAHINYYPADVNEVYQPNIEVVGDIPTTIQAVADTIKPKNWDFSASVKAKQAGQIDIMDKSDSNAFPLKPQRFMQELRRLMPNDGVVSLDNGMHKLWVTRNYPAYQPNTVLADNGLATMGAGLPVGMTVKMLDPKKKVVVVAGDGGFMMNLADLETAKRLGLDLVIVILNDNGYGMIKWKQAGMGLTDYGLDFTNPDFVKLAESFGVKGVRVNSAKDFSPTLKNAINQKGVTIIDLPIDYSENITLDSAALKARF